MLKRVWSSAVCKCYISVSLANHDWEKLLDININNSGERKKKKSERGNNSSGTFSLIVLAYRLFTESFEDVFVPAPLSHSPVHSLCSVLAWSGETYSLEHLPMISVGWP